MKTASAPAKAILLGEHTALYGNPVLVTALDLRSYVTVSKHDSDEIIVNAPDLNIEKSMLREQRGTELIKMGVGLVGGGGFEINIKSDIPIASGLGSSASISSALMMALNAEMDLDSHMRVIAQEAWKCENMVHLKSSGVDPFAVTYGGLTFYKKGLIEKIITKNSLELVVAHSGISSDTGTIVSELDSNSSTDEFKEFLKKSEGLVVDGKKAALKQDWKKLGELMGKNHDLLADMSLSNGKLESLVTAARDSGAYGAKLSGAGRGGIMVALVDENTKNDVSKALSNMGGKIIRTKVTVEGVKLE